MRVLRLLIILVVFIAFSATMANAEADIKVSLDDELLEFDVQPMSLNGRTLLPLRVIFEKLGLVVGWDEVNSIVIGTKENIKIELPIGNNLAKLNGKNIELDVPAIIKDGRTLVPVRFIAESVGLKVDWDGKTRRVILSNVYSKEIKKLEENNKNEENKSISNLEYVENLEKELIDLEKNYLEKEKELILNNDFFTYDNGDRMIDINRNDIGTNISIFIWANGAKYIEDFDGTNTGKGMYIWAEGDKYIGDFVDGKRTGKGLIIWANGDKYIGDFKDDNMTGIGRLFYSDGSRTPVGYFEKGEYISENFGKLYSEITFKPQLNQKTLILLVDMEDVKIKNSESDWNSLVFNKDIKSVNDYYDINSNGKISFVPAEENYGMVNDGVIKVALDFPHPNPTIIDDSLEKIAHDALEKADEYIDFKNYDTNNNGSIEESELHIITVIAGYGTGGGPKNKPGFRAHASQLWKYPLILDDIDINSYIEVSDKEYVEWDNNEHMSTIGVISHELAHELGLPDLYDTDESSQGIGIHSIMGGGAYLKIAGENSGETPVSLDAWSKIKLGLVEPTIVKESGVYGLYSSNLEKYNVLKIVTPNPNEYFLLENRQFTGYNEGLKDFVKSGGIIIWHIDESIINEYESDNKVNDDENNKGVDIEEANEGELGYSQLDKNIDYSYDEIYDHYFYQGGNDEFGPDTTPSSELNNGEDSGIYIKVEGKGEIITVNINIE